MGLRQENLEDKMTEWEECEANINRGESVIYDALSVEGGSNMLKETDVEMLDEEEHKRRKKRILLHQCTQARSQDLLKGGYVDVCMRI